MAWTIFSILHSFCLYFKIQIFKNTLKTIQIINICYPNKFSSENKISVNFNKNLKFNNLNIESKININQLVVKNDFINLKPYLPNLDKIINFENHKIIINYDKNKTDIKGNGEISIKFVSCQHTKQYKIIFLFLLIVHIKTSSRY